MLIDSLVERIVAVLGSLLPAGTPCALLDFPMYPNVGDNAIWLGQRLALQAIGARVVYVADQSTFVPDHLATRLKGGTILLQGGGDLGDLWPVHQYFREAVVSGFPNHAIIQLPQTINFREASAVRQARAVFNLHPNLTLLLRDQRSVEFAQAVFKNTSMLCPDMALALGPLTRGKAPSVGVLRLYRIDKESAHPLAGPPDVSGEQVDWVTEPTGFQTGARTVLKWLNRYRRLFESVWRYTPRLYDALARQRLAYGCDLLSRGQVVITDRLHGHILSALLGIPHVLLDDRYHKVRDFYETWTKDCQLTTWAGSVEEALQLAEARAQGDRFAQAYGMGEQSPQ